MEDDLIRRLDKKCDESKKSRQQFINMSKRYASNQDAYEMYLQKAEEVDMSFCKTLKKDQEII